MPLGGWGGGVGRDTKGEAGRPSAWSLSRTWERKWVVLCLSVKVDV